MSLIDQEHYLTLNTGLKMPPLGLGLWKMDKSCCAQVVYDAIKTGYRLLDSACDYGNEQQTGEGIERALKDGLCKREDLFVVSKLWNTFHRPEHVKPALLRSLKDMKVDYLDLYIIHFPISLKYVDPEVRYPPEWIHDPKAENPRMEPDHGVTYQETWQAMEELVKEGLVKNIGVSNVGTVKIIDVIKYAKIKPAILQVEMHPFLAQEKLLRFTHMQGIHVMSYSNFGSLSYVSIGLATEADTCLLSPALLNPAEKYKKTPA
jgi:D-xylose reductase